MAQMARNHNPTFHRNQERVTFQPQTRFGSLAWSTTDMVKDDSSSPGQTNWPEIQSPHVVQQAQHSNRRIGRFMRNNHYISMTSLEDMKQFDLLGRLNQFGQLQLWKEVDYSIKKFDRHEINLTTREDPHALTKTKKLQQFAHNSCR